MTITYDSHFNGNPIQTNKDKGQGSSIDILEKLDDQMTYMTASHSKVLQTRVDIHYPHNYQGIPNQKDFCKFCKNFKRNLENNYTIPQGDQQRGKRKKDNDGNALIPQHKVDPHIVLVPEQHGKNRNPHAHVVVQVNGNAKRNPLDIMKRAEREWATVLGIESAKGLVHYCNTNGPAHHFIDRNSNDFEESKQAAFLHSSYLAKTNGKEYRPKGQWRVLGTRIPQ